MVTLLWTDQREAEPALWTRLPAWKVAQLLRQRSGDTRRQSLLCWALLEAALGPALSRVEQAPGGKPYLPGGPAFSLSHCPQFAVVALSDTSVGVDVEPLSALETPAAVRDWTARESWGKCRGTGPAQAPPPAGPGLWTGRIRDCILSVCTASGAAAPENKTEWDGKRYVG